MLKRFSWHLLSAALFVVLVAACAREPVAPTPAASPAAAPKVASPAASPAAKVSPSPAAKVSPSPAAKVASPVPATKVASPSPSPVAGEVTFIANEYSFTGPDSIPGGWTRVRMVNQGQELHHLGLLRLAEGRTMADFLAALQAAAQNPDAGPPAGLFMQEGGPNAVGPGADSIAIVNLEPGTYVLVCFIPDAQGVPHVAQGMFKQVTVTAARTAATEPRANITIDGSDFRFDITPELTAGSHMIRFNNTGGQHHEVQVVEVAPGRTVQDFVDFAESGQGPPPGRPLGGMAPLDPGDSGYFPLQVRPGTYGFICFLPDVTDPQGTPHFAKGMIQEVTVR